jgi:Uma2 family endonuclease
MAHMTHVVLRWPHARVRYDLGQPSISRGMAPGRRRQEVLGRLYLRLGAHVEERGGGSVFVAPFDVVLNEADVVRPDIVFVADGLDVLNNDNIRGCPSFVIDVLCRERGHRDLEMKLGAYARSRVPECWIVDPDADTVFAYRQQGGVFVGPTVYDRTQTVSPLAPADFVLHLSDLFGRREASGHAEPYERRTP